MSGPGERENDWENLPDERAKRFAVTDPDEIRFGELVFGYGSLVNPLDRREQLGRGEFVPADLALLPGWTRVEPDRDNIRPLAVGVVDGVAFTASPAELAALDASEMPYVRRQGPLHDGRLAWFYADSE